MPSAIELSSLLSIGLIQLLAVISPGPSFLVTAQTAVAGSRQAGVQVALGLAAGTMVLATAALLGLNALFHAMPTVFLMMKLIGALFLLWMAFQLLRHAADPVPSDELSLLPDKVARHRSPFMRGFTIQLSNPKTLIFFGSIFTAVLPGIIPLWMGIALVLIVSFNEVWWYSFVALVFGSSRVRANYSKSKKWLDRSIGVFLGFVGLRLIWAAIND